MLNFPFCGVGPLCMGKEEKKKQVFVGGGPPGSWGIKINQNRKSMLFSDTNRVFLPKNKIGAGKYGGVLPLFFTTFENIWFPPTRS